MPEKNYFEQLYADNVALMEDLIANPWKLKPGMTVEMVTSLVTWLKANEKVASSQIFTHVAPEDEGGTVTHINMTAVQEYIDRKPFKFELINVPLDRALYQHVIIKNGVEEHHVKRLIGNPFLFKPLIWLIFTDSAGKEWHVLADGNHRLVRLYRDGYREVRGYMVPEKVWRRHTVEYPETLDSFAERITRGEAAAKEKIYS